MRGPNHVGESQNGERWSYKEDKEVANEKVILTGSEVTFPLVERRQIGPRGQPTKFGFLASIVPGQISAGKKLVFGPLQDLFQPVR